MKEAYRDQRGLPVLETLWQDIRYGARMLRKNPGFTAVAVLTLALGIGANTAIFTLVNFVFFASPSAEKPNELVSVFFGDARGQGTSNHSYADYTDYRRETVDVLSGIAAFTPVPANLLVGQGTERVSVGLVSDNYFSVLGVRPIVGRTFWPDENQTPGAHPVAVISESLWRRQFAGDHDVTRKRIWLNNASYTVVGVVPESAARMVAVIKVDVFVPAMMQGVIGQGRDYLSERGNKEFMVSGRLRPGIPLSQAQSRFNVLADQLAKQYPEAWTDHGRVRPLTIVPQIRSQLPFELRGYAVGFMALLLSVVGTVLVIACANIANFLLARATARRRETAVRLALGATRRRMIRQLLTEGLLLSGAGGAAALLVAFCATDLFAAFVPSLGVPLAFDLHLDHRVLLFNLATTLATAVVFGLAPALQASRPDVVQGLREGDEAPVSAGRRCSLRNALVVGQVAASLVLLLCAGMFVRSLGKLHSIELGFSHNNTALLSVDLALQGYSPERGRVFYNQAIERIQHLPGVAAVEAARRVPLGTSKIGQQFVPQGQERRPEEAYLGFNIVGPRYFEAMEIPILQGRSFTAQDREGAARVAIVNETLAERFWPGQTPLGKRLFQGNNSWVEIIGVCKAAKYHSLTEGPTPYVYLPLLQHYSSSLTFHVRTRSAPSGLLHTVRQELLSLDPTLAVFDATTMNEHLAVSMLPARIGAILLGTFGALALGLAILGLYGVMSYAVARRTREIGIRVALGARRRDVFRLIVQHGMKLTFAGVFIGLLLGSGLTAVIATQLYGVSATDIVTLAGMPLTLAAAAFVACWLPARRATKVDPMVALRYE